LTLKEIKTKKADTKRTAGGGCEIREVTTAKGDYAVGDWVIECMGAVQRVTKPNA